MGISRPGSLSQALAEGLSRRDVIRLTGATGLALTVGIATGGRAVQVLAQDATPIASPTGGGSTGGFAYVGTYTRNAPGGAGEATAVGIRRFSGRCRDRRLLPGADSPE